MPSSTTLVEEFLSQLIEDSPESAFERGSKQAGAYEHLQDIDFAERNVMIGSLYNKRQLQLNLKHRFYQIPMNNIATDREKIEYVALYEQKYVSEDGSGRIAYYGKVKNCTKRKRKDFAHIIPVTRNNPDEEYYFFTVESWQRLKKPMRPKGYGVATRMYTNLYLLEHGDYLPELFIRSKEEYRLLVELKRITEKYCVEPLKKFADEGAVVRFQYNGAWIHIEDGEIRVTKYPNAESYRIDELKKDTMKVVREITGWIDATS